MRQVGEVCLLFGFCCPDCNQPRHVESTHKPVCVMYAMQHVSRGFATRAAEGDVLEASPSSPCQQHGHQDLTLIPQNRSTEKPSIAAVEGCLRTATLCYIVQQS